MHVSNLGERQLTELDCRRLRRVAVAGSVPQLAALLDDATVVSSPEIPPDVVTMYARFVLRDLMTQERQFLVLCYPADTDPAHGCISVLSPAGLALIGLPAGAVARWVGPGGEERVVQLEEIVFQPEASGDYVT